MVNYGVLMFSGGKVADNGYSPLTPRSSPESSQRSSPQHLETSFSHPEAHFVYAGSDSRKRNATTPLEQYPGNGDTGNDVWGDDDVSMTSQEHHEAPVYVNREKPGPKKGSKRGMCIFTSHVYIYII